MESSWASLPWYRRPGVAWMYPFVVILALNLLMPAGPAAEELVRLACVVVESGAPGTNTSVPTLPGVTPLPLALSTASRLWNSTTAIPDVDLEACKHNIDVQRLLSHLNLMMETIHGFLSALTTAYWASLSDRVGRQKIIALAMFGIFIKDAIFLFVLNFPQTMVATGGSVLYLGFIIIGLSGGGPMANAVMMAYVSDVTTLDTMAVSTVGVETVLALVSMIAPLLGPLLVAASGNRLLPFQVTMVTWLLLLAFLLFAVPESLSPEKRAQLAKTAEAEREAAAKADIAFDAEEDRAYAEARARLHDAHGSSSTLHYAWQRVIHSHAMRRTVRGVRRLTARFLAPLESLTIFLPRARDPGNPRKGRDWNLFLLAIVMFCIPLARSESPEVQYLIYVFGWGQTELATRKSLIGIWSTALVASIVPFYTYVVKPYLVKRIEAGDAAEPVDPEEPTERTPLLPALLAEVEDEPVVYTAEDEPPAYPGDSGISATSTASSADAAPSLRVDWGFITLSLLFELVGFAAKGANAGASRYVYIAGHAIAMLGQSAGSVLLPLALRLGPKERTAGRMFGASSVLGAIASPFLSSILFNTVFRLTIAWYPATIFVVCAAVYAVGIVAMSFMRIRSVSAA
ncbi:hypothetical protein Q8F55_001644 [Vanrija albida]|uniref:Major facilitator superfamily (MFS) profile domain-containing protein n=1 Tax=Vanrija albida TaxID=181172 RepID=A0ABR3Q864_9TREE